MTNILIRGGDVITMAAGATVLRGTDVVVQGSFIQGIGEPPPQFEPDEIVDARGCIVMPGLFNAHMHSGTVYSRGLSPYHGLDPWFDLRAVQDGQLQCEVKSEMTAEDAYWGALLAAAESIRGGVVGCGDQYFFMDSVAQAVAESGLRASLAWCTFGGDDGEIGGDLAAVASFVETWQGAGEGRVKTSLGPHSSYLCAPQFLARTAAVAARLGAPIRIRVSESQEQVDFSLLAYDMTPLEVLDKNGLFDAPLVAVNAAYLNEVDIAILASRGAAVVACPSAQRAAGLATVPIERLQAAGVAVGLGSDGAGLVGAVSMFDAMRDAAISLRDGLETRIEALRLATWGGAQVLGFNDCGVLAPGYCADLILVDTRKTHFWPVHDPRAAVLTSAVPGDVMAVMVGGNWLMRDGQLTTIDEERVLAETAKRAERLHRRTAESRGR